MKFRPQKSPCTGAKGSGGTNNDGLENKWFRAVCEGPEELLFWRDLEQVLNTKSSAEACV